IADSSLYVLTMGVLQPSDSRLGTLVKFDALTGTGQTMLDSLQRPVHFVLEDLNQDGRKDIVVAEFGNQSGQLSWHEQTPQNTFLKHILRAQPGEIRIIKTDWNKDGHPDIVVLMAQGDEGV
ncbi:VCBS repeat-containing protein, partial [Flavihumibacter sediminis]|nr:VCBS repeat-containing protein [Flavihumibacter sediminis]